MVGTQDVTGREELDVSPGPAAIVAADDTVAHRLPPAGSRDGEESSTEGLRARLAAIVECSDDAIISESLEGTIETWNPAAERLYGYTAAEAIGRPMAMLVPEERQDEIREMLERVRRGERIDHYETVRVSRSGRRLDVSVTLSPMRDAAGRVIAASMVERDITEQKELERQLRHQALHDSLTGLPNRALLLDRLQQLVFTAHREGISFALLLMDLDRFKEINDTFGHPYGDLLLQEVAVRFRQTLRESDTIARLGGDEFALLLPSVDERGAILTAGRVLTALSQGFVVEGQSLEVDGSVGIVCYPQHGENAQTLLQRADVAMYVAKRANIWYSVYEPEQDQYSASRLALMGELRHAIEHEELSLHYQPKVDLTCGQVVGVEALIRWRHPERGMVPPGEFIPHAERTTLMSPLTAWVVNEALRQCRLWHDVGLELRVQVNLSARLHDPHLVDMITDALTTWQVAPHWLGVEITESTVMINAEHAMNVLGRLAGMGVSISIDDFGTGYSSLAYLQRLPVDEIKIDRSFVKDMVTNPNDAKIVRATVGLVHDLEKKALAEGVEDQETCNLLVSLGCDLAQGYFLGRPMPPDDLLPWLRKRKGVERREPNGSGR